MKKIESINELHEILYSLVVSFDKFCEKHSITYMLSDGSCLGAVRHHDFIPWDDDMDVYVPRPDYIKLSELIKTEKNLDFDYISPENDETGLYPFPFGKIYFPNSRIIDETEYYKPYNIGIYVDIFPLDGLPDEKKEMEKLQNRVNMIKQPAMGTMWINRGNEKPLIKLINNIGTFIPHLLYKQIRPFFTKKANEVASKINFDDANYCGNIIWGEGIERSAVKKEVLFPVRRIKFRDSMLCVPNDYDTYLKKAYGNDYMELPPVEKRITHGFTAWINS